MNAKDNKDNTSIVIDNSPIEFVIIGSKGKKDGVLARSKGAQMDLIGFAASTRAKQERPTIRISASVLQPPRTLCTVESYPLDQRVNAWDARKSEYLFGWVGLCSESDRKKIRYIFNQYVVDLQSGIEEGDTEQVEWGLSPVIVKCLEVHARHERRFRIFIPLGLIGAAISFLMYILFIVVYFLRFR